MNYTKIQVNNDTWVIVEDGKTWKSPHKAVTFAFDTETLVYLDGKIESQKTIFEKLKDVSTNEKRQRLYNKVWAWQCYDEYNGFFMTNNFEVWLYYQCLCGYKFGWCYNATFDFAQINYEILANGADKWKPHESRTGKAYNKGQKWTYESIHNDSGARYAYKLWIPYKNQNRHTYTHAVEYRDFMKLVAGGLKNVLKDLDVKDNDGNPVRKLSMEYQAVDTNNLTQNEIDYCCNDVKGLYFAIKIFNTTIEEQSNNELHIFGEETNVMTAGGFAKYELLRSMYPDLKTKKARIKQYQKEHPLTVVQDKYIRDNHLYRGGISYVNPLFKGLLLTADKMGSKMYRYDVNSEYPYAMASIRDLIGKPRKISMQEWETMQDKDEYEAIYMLESVCGTLKENYIGVWYNPFRRDFVDVINENGLHLMFERELFELSYWYDLEYTCENVLILKRGTYAYKPFIDENYELKAKAKAEGNKTVQTSTKLKLNSSYGKLAERIERRYGHYELNDETGAIHFVEDGIETSETGSMNVIIGALVTCVARCYILSKIREVCGDDIKHKFVYIDTDSIHAFASYDKADAYSLGGLKLEAECDAVKYIAPKTYIDIESVSNGVVNKDKDNNYMIEVHSKGVSTAVVFNELSKQENLTLDYIDKQIAYGAKYVILCAMNVKGGKVLVPTEKYLARPELAPDGVPVFINNGYDGQYLTEQ